MKYSLRSDDWRGNLEAFAKLPGAMVRYRDTSVSSEVRSGVNRDFPFLERFPDYLDYLAEVECAVINLDEQPDESLADYHNFSFFPVYELFNLADWLEDGFFRIASSCERVKPGNEGIAEYVFALTTRGDDRTIYSQTVGDSNFTAECDGFANLIQLVVMQKGRFLTAL
jgi:hypothetical protein